MPATLPAAARSLLDQKTFATVATVNRDGSPQTSVVWVKRDGDALLFSALATRRKVRNLTRDARVSVSFFALEDPYHMFEVRGTAEVIDDPEKALSFELSHKYMGTDPEPEPADRKRVIVRITPERVIEFPV